MNTSIGITGISDMLDRINEVSSIDEILAFIKKIDALKAALEAAETFRQQSIMYAKLGANALIRAVELGWLSKLRGTHKPTAEWLYGLSEQERDKYITMCEDGLTIDQVYKREIGDARKLNEQIKEVEYWRNSLVEDSKKIGIVDMKPFVEKVREVFKGDKRQIGNDIIDGTRNRLRQSGAVTPLDRMYALLSAKSKGIKTWISFEPVVDAGMVLQRIKWAGEHGVDKIKIGKLNYHPSNINWEQFGEQAEALCKELGIDYYIKESLRKEM